MSAVALAGALARSRDFLAAVWDDERKLFPYSSRIAGDGYTSDYDHPLALRYTINSLLGLQAAAEPWEQKTEEFLSRHYGSVSNDGDAGLLLVLLRDDPPRDLLERVVAASRSARSLNMQELGWLIWGATAAGATDAAASLLTTLREDFAHPRTRLPVHTVSRLRRHVVSFGSCVYYLRALHEAERVLGDEAAAAAFRAGVQRLIDVQGRNGEWPWLISVASGRALDLYPVFSVHQHSMAMLFLLPALDLREPRVAGAIERSWSWLHGRNDLATPMVVEEPFLVFRSIERRDRLPRARRYLRTLRRATAAPLPPAALRINHESRSYEHGWLLYAWAGRDDVPEL